MNKFMDIPEFIIKRIFTSKKELFDIEDPTYHDFDIENVK